MQPTDDERRLALRRAEKREQSLARLRQDERDAVDLLEKIGGLSMSLFQLAQDWDVIDADIANRVRKQERELHELRTVVRRMAEIEVDEAGAIMGEIREILKQARGE